MYPPFFVGKATPGDGQQQEPQEPQEPQQGEMKEVESTSGAGIGNGGGGGMAPMSIEQQGDGGGGDHDAARAAEIEKEAAYEKGIFRQREDAADASAGGAEGKNGTATGQGLGPIGEGAAGGAEAGAAAGEQGNWKACCTNYWKGYSTGYTLLGVGFLIMALSALIRARFDKMYLAKLKDKLAVTSMDAAQNTPHWFTNSDGNTASLVSLYFYNLTNSADFLQGQPPTFDLVGPYTYRTYWHKADVAFSDDGSGVEFAVNQKQVFQPDKSQQGTDNVNVTVLNSAYMTAVARKRSESNMVRAGVPRVLSGYKEKSMPQMATDLRALLLGGWGEREGDFAKAVRLMKADLGAEVFAERWAKGDFGPDKEEEVGTALNSPDKEDAAYNRALLDTGDNLNLPLALAQQLLDPADANSLTAPNTPEAKARKGLLLWAGPATGKAALLTHFQGRGMTQVHSDAISAYVGRIMGTPEVEARLLEAVALGPAYKTVDDLTWRQFTVTDVLSRLSSNGAADSPTLQGTSLAQLGQGNIYVAEPLVAGPEAEAVPMAELGYVLRSQKARATLPLTEEEATYLPAKPRTAAEAAAQWGQGDAKGKCLMDVMLRNKTYYENQLLAVPAVLLEDDFAHTYALQSNPLQYGPIELCMEVEAQDPATLQRPVTPDWADVQTYINYLGQSQIAGLFRLLVVNSNGGLVITRTVKEMVLGHVEPLFPLSLGPDHPAAKGAAILSNSPFPLDAAHAYCTNSADVQHPLWSCRLDTEASNATTKVYRKVPSKFLTGKGDAFDDLMGQRDYFGQTANIPILYPSGAESVVTDLSTAVQQLSSGAGAAPLQKGFSTGEQFTPLKMRDIASPPPLWVLRQKGPMPMRFDYAEDVEHDGIHAKRFTLAEPLWQERPGLAAAAPAAAAPAPTEALKPPGGRQRRRLRSRRTQEQQQAPSSSASGVGLTYQTATGKYSVSRFMNVTLGNNVPQYMAVTAAAGLQDDPVLGAASPKALQRAREVDAPSFLDVEPWTGKTIAQRSQVQVSFSLVDASAGSYDLYYKTAYQGPWMPLLFAQSMTTIDEKDAATFRRKLFAPKKIVKGASAAGLPIGALIALAGGLIVYRARQEKQRKKEARRKRREERRRRRAERAAAAAAAGGAAGGVAADGDGDGEGNDEA